MIAKRWSRSDRPCRGLSFLVLLSLANSTLPVMASSAVTISGSCEYYCCAGVYQKGRDVGLLTKCYRGTPEDEKFVPGDSNPTTMVDCYYQNILVMSCNSNEDVFKHGGIDISGADYDLDLLRLDPNRTTVMIAPVLITEHDVYPPGVLHIPDSKEDVLSWKYTPITGEDHEKYPYDSRLDSDTPPGHIVSEQFAVGTVTVLGLIADFFAGGTLVEVSKIWFSYSVSQAQGPALDFDGIHVFGFEVWFDIVLGLLSMYPSLVLGFSLTSEEDTDEWAHRCIMLGGDVERDALAVLGVRGNSDPVAAYEKAKRDGDLVQRALTSTSFNITPGREEPVLVLRSGMYAGLSPFQYENAVGEFDRAVVLESLEVSDIGGTYILRNETHVVDIREVNTGDWAEPLVEGLNCTVTKRKVQNEKGYGYQWRVFSPLEEGKFREEFLVYLRGKIPDLDNVIQSVLCESNTSTIYDNVFQAVKGIIDEKKRRYQLVSCPSTNLNGDRYWFVPAWALIAALSPIGVYMLLLAIRLLNPFHLPYHCNSRTRAYWMGYRDGQLHQSINVDDEDEAHHGDENDFVVKDCSTAMDQTVCIGYSNMEGGEQHFGGASVTSTFVKRDPKLPLLGRPGGSEM